MGNRLAAAEAALKAGRPAEAVEQIEAALAESSNRSAQVYRVLARNLYRLDRFVEGAAAVARGLAKHPRDAELWNLRGVMLRKLGRHAEALEALDKAVKINPRQDSYQVNRGIVLLNLREAAAAEEVFARLVRKAPGSVDLRRRLGQSLRLQGQNEAAIVQFSEAAEIEPGNVDASLDLAGTLSDLGRLADAEATLDAATAHNPDNPRLIEAKAILMRSAGHSRRAEAYLQELAPRFRDAAWLEHRLGVTVVDYDRSRANAHLRRAVELEPNNRAYRFKLIESLERTRTGDEGAHIEESYQLLQPLLADSDHTFTPAQVRAAYAVLARVCAFQELERLGDPTTLGRRWAESGLHAPLMKLLPRVCTLEDRYELLEQHRVWGRRVEAVAAAQPLRRTASRSAGGKIRLGLMSSDLRSHPVGYFVLPLFDHLDERFELFAYSFYQGATADRLQDFISSRSHAFRWKPEMGDREAAQMIGDDQLDFLIELGGSTYMNKLEVMAWRPAPVQASWLGYPHSAGLSTIDYLICDPHTAPPRQDLLIEAPLMMPDCSVALGRQIFSERVSIKPGLPEERAGYLTFGTANNPGKYTPETLSVWSEVMRAVPDSRFLFIRPEGGTASFRGNLLQHFEANGVEPHRIGFRTVRGTHMPHYNDVDITLDCMPQTGGTTTTESLWMGVPVISLVGEALYERLSASVLANSGVHDLATSDRASFVEAAVTLASDRARRLHLRQNLREQMKAGPLGQTETFARNFYDMIARALLRAGPTTPDGTEAPGTCLTPVIVPASNHAATASGPIKMDASEYLGGGSLSADAYSTGSLSVDAYDVIENAVRFYGEDLRFYTDFCSGAERILDLGAGTGRVALALAQAGFKVCGLDLSSGMLETAERNRTNMPLEVQARCAFVQGDMADFSLPDRFARILIPYRSFNHLTTQERQIACLQAIRQHLAPGGTGVVHLATVDHPDMMVEADLREKHGHVRVRIGQDRMVHWEVVSRKVDRLEQILEQEVRYTYRVIDGRVLRSDIAIYRFSWLTRREARHLFARCGLKIIAEYADFNGSPPRPDSDHIIVFGAEGGS